MATTPQIILEMMDQMVTALALVMKEAVTITQEMAKVIAGESLFVAFGSHDPFARRTTRIVDQHVDVFGARGDLARHFGRIRHQREVRA